MPRGPMALEVPKRPMALAVPRGPMALAVPGGPMALEVPKLKNSDIFSVTVPSFAFRKYLDFLKNSKKYLHQISSKFLRIIYSKATDLIFSDFPEISLKIRKISSEFTENHLKLFQK